MRTASYLLFLFLAIIISAIIAVLSYFSYKPQRPSPSKPEESTSAEIPAALPNLPIIRASDPALGKNEAALAIIEFGDFFCTACAEVKLTLQKLLQDYDEKIKLVWKDLPNTNRHPLAQKAAEAARCAAEQGRFWNYHDRLFEAQPILAEEQFLEIARATALEEAKFSQCLTSGRAKELVERSFNEALLLRVDATPYFFIGTERFSGAVDEQKFKDVIEDRLKTP